MGQIIGYSKFQSKKGTDCCVIRVMSPAGERDNKFGHFGNIVQEIFVPDDQHNVINDKVIGKNCVINYTYYNGRGYVDNIVFE